MSHDLRTPRTSLRRHPERGRHDRPAVHAVLDAGVIGQIGYVALGQPRVLPTLYWRAGEAIYWHGARASVALEAMAGAEVCFTVTHLDGLVLARSAFRHSVQYRSVIAFGVPRPVEGEADKLQAMQAMFDRLYPGRWAEIRTPNPAELAAITVLRLDLTEASAKTRSGPPLDFEADLGIPVWAGVAPLEQRTGELQPCAKLGSGTAVPDYLTPWTPARSAVPA